MKKIITISREFGSGGRTIAKEVAARLGYAYYDREIVNEVAKRCGFTEEFIEEYGEYATARNSFLFSIATATPHGTSALSMLDKLYVEQTKIIKEIAQDGNCVIVGRCADYILKENPDALHVFIYADNDFRSKWIVDHYGQTAKAPEKRLSEKDQKRKVYYKNYTGRNWGDPHNYSISLNSSKVGVENCVNFILQIAKSSS